MISKESIIVRVYGGLGNQLFKVMAGLKLSMATSKDLVLDLTWFEYFRDRDGKVAPRSYELDFFPQLANYRRFTSRLPQLNKRIYQATKLLSNDLQKYFGVVRDTAPHNFHNSRSNWILDGRFEDITFLPDDKVLRNILSFPSPSRGVSETIAHLGRNFVAVHVRRGDYLNFPEIYGFLDKDYYQRALVVIKEKFGNLPIVLFSDDTDGAKDWLMDICEFDYVVGARKGLSAGETLQVISQANAVVTAHSTFSWWAAKLGEINENTKLVVTPNRFLSKDWGEDKRLIPPTWTALSV